MSQSNDHTGGRAARFALRPLLLVAGVYHLALGLFQFLGSKQFYDAIGTFPPYNQHFLRDISSIFIAMGVVLLIAAARRSWQVPVLTLVAVQYAVHVLAHIVDFGDAESNGVAISTLLSLAVIGVLMFWMLRVADAEDAR